ncbi:1728_t:CDS:2, partial [Funneliformis geosporum]
EHLSATPIGTDALYLEATVHQLIELYVDGNRLFDPKNTLNGIRITLATIRTHMQRVANETLYYQDLLNIANG